MGNPEESSTQWETLGEPTTAPGGEHLAATVVGATLEEMLLSLSQGTKAASTVAKRVIAKMSVRNLQKRGNHAGASTAERRDTQRQSVPILLKRVEMVREKRAALSVALRSTGRPTAKSQTPAASVGKKVTSQRTARRGLSPRRRRKRTDRLWNTTSQRRPMKTNCSPLASLRG